VPRVLRRRDERKKTITAIVAKFAGHSEEVVNSNIDYLAKTQFSGDD